MSTQNIAIELFVQNRENIFLFWLLKRAVSVYGRSLDRSVHLSAMVQKRYT